MEDELLDYEDAPTVENEVDESGKEKKGTGYVGIHTSGFRDFLLKPELLRSIIDCGFEGPSAVQHECIPQAILGTDVICQAQSGMGKTAVFVLSTLHVLQPVDGEVSVLCMCHTRDLANQIKHEYDRFSKYMEGVRCEVFYGGEPIANNEKVLKDPAKCPHIVVGTPGRILDLVSPDNPSRSRMSLSKLKVFVLDECDKMLETTMNMNMRRDVQSIFRATPRNKQVLMFSATLSKEIRPICKKFMHEPMEIYVDDQSKLSLEGLKQHYVKLTQEAKLKKLVDLLDVLEFNQVFIFVSSVQRCQVLCKHLVDSNFPAMLMHGRMKQEERVEAMKSFKNFEKRIMVTTNLLGRGIDIERVNIVINFDMPEDTDTYLHRVARAGRFGTKGLAISFISTTEDSEILEKVQTRFEVDIQELPEELNLDSYM